MEMFNLLRQTVDTAASLREFTDERKTLVYNVEPPTTLYLDAERAQVRIAYSTDPVIRVNLHLKLASGWQTAAEQDEAGVYVVARRRAVVGGLAAADIGITVPPDTALILKLNACTLALGPLSATLDIAPAPDGSGMIQVQPRA